jgi:hypothetical protein
LLPAAGFKNLPYLPEYNKTPFSNFNIQENTYIEHVQLCAYLEGENLCKFQMINEEKIVILLR